MPALILAPLVLPVACALASVAILAIAVLAIGMRR